MKKNKPLILVVNDDGIEAVGIRVLISVMRSIGDVYVVAPDSNRSGASHSMTLHKEIVIKNIDKQQYEFTCSGTPVDCVKVAFNKILPRKPDLCVSGINHGSNHSINSLYSGTLHAAMEATIQGVSSIAFSHLSYDQKTDLTEFSSFIKQISELLIANKLPREITLNINFPDVPYNDIRGVRLCNQGKGSWTEIFTSTYSSDLQTNYLLSGHFNDDNSDIKTDSWALSNQFISIVPVHLNCADPSIMNTLKYLENAF